MLRPSFAALIAIASASCGTAPHKEEALTHKAHAQVQSWDKGPEYAARKKVIYDTVKSAGRGDDVAALLQAMAMIETDSLLSSQRDTSKDGAGMARNFSLYNFNLDCLTQLGYDASKAEALNSDDAIADATRAALAGIDKFGAEGFQNFHRGGSEGLRTGTAYGCCDYRAGIAATQQKILSTPNAFFDGCRYALYIQHV